MDDKKAAASQTPRRAGEEEPQALDKRGRQDLECLSLLREAYELRKEAEYLDGMFASLQGGERKLPPEVDELLKQLDN